MTTEYKKPVPVPSPESLPFWQSCKRHAMEVQRCKQCGQYRWPPSTVCAGCLSMDLEWTPVSGRGKVHTFVIFHQRYNPAFADDIPYTVGIVELEEGPRILTNIVGCATTDVRCDMPVEVVYEDITPEIALPKFRPRG
jgi:uncharacterized OB-fold protein